MKEKFGYLITSHNTIKIYRIMGQYVMNSNGDNEWQTDMSRVAHSHSWDVKNYIVPSRYTSKDKELYDTRAEAEAAAKEQLKQSLVRSLEQHKKAMRGLEDQINNMKVKYFNCGGK